MKALYSQWRIQREALGDQDAPSPSSASLLTDLTLVWGWNSYIDKIVYHFLTGSFFLIKRALHFATKQNSRDIQKYNCFWVPSYDLFASARKAVFSAPTATGVHGLIEKCVVISAFSAGHKKVKQSILYQNLDFPPPPPPPPPTKNCWIRPWFRRRNCVEVSFWIKALYY